MADIDYDGRRFRPEEEPAGRNGTRATYHQDGDTIWGEFSGGKVRSGALTGTRNPDGTLHFGYSMVLAGGEIVVGRCRSTPSRLDDGRILLTEQWERYWPQAAAGTSRLVESRGLPPRGRHPACAARTRSDPVR